VLAGPALSLRAWALALLPGGEAGPPPPAPPPAWELFLRSERCAILLRSQLDAGSVPADVRPVLQEASARELRRAMALRGELAFLGRILRREGWTGVALKAGAAAADGDATLDVADLDLLVRPGDVRAVADALAANGYRHAGHDDRIDTDDPGAWELGARIREGSLQVELHFAVPFLGDDVDVWKGTVPTAIPGISRLAPATHLWHVLVHGVAHHVERRGAVRDLLLVRAALARCTPAEVGTVEARAARHPLRAVLAATLALARDGAAAPDPFRRVAAMRMRMLEAGLPSLPGPLGRAFVSATLAFAAGGGEYWRLWRGSHASVLVGPRARGARAVDRLPVLAWPLRVASRGAFLAAATVPAWAFARAATRGAAG
jgi:hypothetical protein